MNTGSHADNSKKKIKILVAIVVVLALVCGICVAVFVSKLEDKNSDETKIVEQVTNKASGYDIDKLAKTYPDIVAWLDVPNTGISMPICQHPTDDFFYLNHDATATPDRAGATYMELCNKKDFSDPVTVCYGHNLTDGRMLHAMHYFEDKKFFDENDKFYVYTKGHKLTYTVVAAYVSDNSHIINTHNFSDVNVLRAYQQEIMTGRSTSKNVRPGITLKDDSKILQISTCMTDLSLKNQRYLVTGVLTDDQETF